MKNHITFFLTSFVFFYTVSSNGMISKGMIRRFYSTIIVMCPKCGNKFHHQDPATNPKKVIPSSEDPWSPLALSHMAATGQAGHLGTGGYLDNSTFEPPK